MTIGGLNPREDQVAALTQGILLPTPRLHETHLAIIADVIAEAWNFMLGKNPGVLSAGSENEINALLESNLNRIIDENALYSSLIHVVARGKETISFDGSHLQKEPDLSVYLTNNRRNFPLVVECKLISQSEGKTVGLYCSHGLARFVNGEYAWASTEAIMIAYVRDGSSLTNTLVPHLEMNRAAAIDPYRTSAVTTETSLSIFDTATSVHFRTFRYLPDPATGNPGPISLWHLWAETS